jgi:DNA-binding response OmpR family regulator
MIHKIEPKIITLLVLEDSETARTIYRRYLRSQNDFNCRILEAATLAEGIRIWQSDRPDLVLVDVNLPDGSGLEFLEIISAEYPDRNLPAIVLTARDDEATVMRAMELGAADYLIKENITAIALNISIRNQLRYAAAVRREVERSQQQEAASAEVALRIRQSLDLDEILTCAVREVREVLSVDRAVIYQFNPDKSSGKIVAESVLYPWRSCLDMQLEDNCFEDKLSLAYREGRVFVANDIYTSNLTQCHLQLLAEFQVRANIAVPILLPNATDQSPPFCRGGAPMPAPTKGGRSPVGVINCSSM